MARTPRYREIANDLRRRLADGEWPVGSTIPGISALQGEYEVPGLQTIRRAQGVLQNEGLLEPRQGSGTFVVALPDRGAADRAELREVVTDLQHALGAALATLHRVARQLDEHVHYWCPSCKMVVPDGEWSLEITDGIPRHNACRTALVERI